MKKSIPANLKSQTWLAPAKLNLFLHIVGQRNDGYHLLQTVIQFIDLCDQIRFAILDDRTIQRENTIVDIEQEEDLCIRAARLLQKTCSAQQGASINIQKVIPMGAGLGGGSSDAATTLLALNQLWDCGLDLRELEELGMQLGADVPIFIRGKACWVEGIGEQLTPIDLPESWYVVIFPNVHLDTKQMFSNPDLTRNCTPIKIRDFTQQYTRNVFEPIARRQQIEVERAFQWLNRYTPARLTGSGSAMFATCESQSQAQGIAEDCPAEWAAFVTKGCNYSPASLQCEYN